MSQEVFKNQRLSSHEMFQAKSWEGKPLKYKFKFLIANYPEMALSTFGIIALVPAILAVKYFLHNKEKEIALQKFKANYCVVRDDDPNVESIRQLKEFGREFFPQ